jgi:hypothetical protein
MANSRPSLTRPCRGSNTFGFEIHDSGRGDFGPCVLAKVIYIRRSCAALPIARFNAREA